MNDAAPTVHLVDDEPAVRDSLSLLIASEGYSVAAHASAREFLDGCPPGTRGCVVADLRMPGMNGLQLQEEMARRGILLSIIFLTGHGDIPTSVRAIKAGAVDFLTKPVTANELLQAIAAALALSDQRLADSSRSSSAAELISHLTERERAVMKLAAAGLSNKVIARQLGISHRTVEIHKGRVMKKTGATSLINLTRLVRAAGFDDPGPDPLPGA